MYKIGYFQTLEVVDQFERGVYLNISEESEEERLSNVLLPRKHMDKELNIGDEVEVFIYRDSEDRLIATTKTPMITMGEIKFLKVAQVTKIGAFLEWGLEKDLFLPFKEQTYEVKEGKKYLVMLYLDKSERLCATMDIYKRLVCEAPYKEGDNITGTVYKTNREMGVFVAVDNKYHGLIPKREAFGNIEIGKEVTGTVLAVREDGKLDISVRGKAYKNMDEDSEAVLNMLDKNGGFIDINDNTDPDKIKEMFGFSKRAFKRAVGRLLKEGKIEFINDGISKK